MTRMTEGERSAWIAALGRRTRRRVASANWPGRARAEAAAPPKMQGDADGARRGGGP